MREQVEQLLLDIAKKLDVPYQGVVLEEPPHHVEADFATNIALQVAKLKGENPRVVAQAFATELESHPWIDTVSIAGPGFLNLNLNDTAYHECSQVLFADQCIAETVDPKRVVVEYISANPTGPLHIGNARGGPIGEVIARVLEARGHQVRRDFYVNDIGGQADTFAASVLHYYTLHLGGESTFPEKGYPAPYVQALGVEIAEREGHSILQLPEAERIAAMRPRAISAMVETLKATVARMGIAFDTWSNQSELETSGRATNTLKQLRDHDSVFEKDGALWLKSGITDDDRETVLVKSNGAHTYFLDDIAFYQMKLDEWGNDYGVCVLGANHSGHIPRMQAGLAGLGMDAGRYHGVMYQYVQLKEDGETKRMAKREGTFVTADDVLNDIPLDVFTWFMVSKAAETHLDFDLQLAKDTSEKNPVYYVQYAHARTQSILAKAVAPQMEASQTYTKEERALVRYLAQFAATVNEVEETYRTNLIPNYLFELATRFHHFYAHNRVIDEANGAETVKRIALVRQVSQVLKVGLGLLGITALDHMERESAA